jgi:hypothetical protein
MDDQLAREANKYLMGLDAEAEQDRYADDVGAGFEARVAGGQVNLLRDVITSGPNSPWPKHYQETFEAMNVRQVQFVAWLLFDAAFQLTNEDWFLIANENAGLDIDEDWRLD